jgi:hypothetical protein
MIRVKDIYREVKKIVSNADDTFVFQRITDAGSEELCSRVNSFLGERLLSRDLLLSVVDPALYRNRSR